MKQEIQEWPKQILVNGQPVVVQNAEEEAAAKRTEHKAKASPTPEPVEVGHADGTVTVTKTEPEKVTGDPSKPAGNIADVANKAEKKK